MSYSGLSTSPPLAMSPEIMIQTQLHLFSALCTVRSRFLMANKRRKELEYSFNAYLYPSHAQINVRIETQSNPSQQTREQRQKQEMQQRQQREIIVDDIRKVNIQLASLLKDEQCVLCEIKMIQARIQQAINGILMAGRITGAEQYLYQLQRYPYPCAYPCLYQNYNFPVGNTMLTLGTQSYDGHHQMGYYTCGSYGNYGNVNLPLAPSSGEQYVRIGGVAVRETGNGNGNEFTDVNGNSFATPTQSGSFAGCSHLQPGNCQPQSVTPSLPISNQQDLPQPSLVTQHTRRDSVLDKDCNNASDGATLKAERLQNLIKRKATSKVKLVGEGNAVVTNAQDKPVSPKQSNAVRTESMSSCDNDAGTCSHDDGIGGNDSATSETHNNVNNSRSNSSYYSDESPLIIFDQNMELFKVESACEGDEHAHGHGHGHGRGGEEERKMGKEKEDDSGDGDRRRIGRDGDDDGQISPRTLSVSKLTILG